MWFTIVGATTITCMLSLLATLTWHTAGTLQSGRPTTRHGAGYRLLCDPKLDSLALLPASPAPAGGVSRRSRSQSTRNPNSG